MNTIRLGVVLGALVLPGIAAPLNAQTVDELRARVARTEMELEVARAAEQRADRALLSTIPLDTMGIGPLSLVVQNDEAGVTSQAAERAWQLLQEHLGDDTDLLEGLEVRVRWSERPAVEIISDAWSRGVDLGETPVENLTNHLMDAVFYLIGETHAGSVAERWFGGSFPRPTASEPRWLRAYTEMATAPYRSTRECLLGDQDECRRALGLIPSANPAADWYTDAGRRALVQRRRRPSERLYPRRAAQHDQCLEGNDAACSAALSDWNVGPPLGPMTRETLVQHAFRTGGPAAYSRLRTTTGTIEERLAAAAGVSGDVLIRSWQDTTLDAAGQPTAANVPIVLTALSWIGVFTLLALRSTRWR
jgi:hypothetical protein